METLPFIKPKNLKTMLLASLLATPMMADAQEPIPFATEDIELQCVGGSPSRCGLAYNPNMKLYYSVDAGGNDEGYPIETFLWNGEKLDIKGPGFDYRGLWWNTNTHQLEGNGFNGDGVWIQALDKEGIPLGEGMVDVPNITKPNVNSAGAYDDQDDEIIYYDNGKVYRYSRSNHAFLGDVVVANLPKNKVTRYSCVYTGVSGGEVGIYNHMEGILYFVNKFTGAIMAQSLLPADPPPATKWGLGFGNGNLFLFDKSESIWKGYKVVTPPAVSLDENEMDVDLNIYPNPTKGNLNIGFSEAHTGVDVEIIGTNGQVMAQSQFSTGEDVKMDVSQLTTGVYLVNVKMGEAIHHLRFMKE